MSVITTQTIPGAMRDGLFGFFGMEYDKIDPEWTHIFEQKTSSRQWEEVLERVGLNNPSFKQEGAEMKELKAGQGGTARYYHQILAGFFSITKQARRDGRYGSEAARFLRDMATGFNEVKEISGASILNNAYESDAPGADGKPLLATDHPNPDGTTWTNIFGQGDTGMPLTYETLKDVTQALPLMLRSAGQHAGIKANKLIVHMNLETDAWEVLMSKGKPGTMNNNENALMGLKKIPGGVVASTFLEDPNAWFVQTTAPDGLCHFERDPMESTMEADFATGNMKYGQETRFSFGWSDSRGLAGPPSV